MVMSSTKRTRTTLRTAIASAARANDGGIENGLRVMPRVPEREERDRLVYDLLAAL